MKVSISETYDEMSKKAFDEISQIMANRKNPLICTASGDSPAGLYKEIIKNYSDQDKTATWNFVGLDEWVGMNENDNGSCHYHLNQQLFHPLNVSKERLCFFDGRAIELEEECTKVEDFIHKKGGIDVAIVGVGLNGHVGMNEPGTPPKLKSHVADIDPLTQQVGQKYFKEEKSLTKGLTLGIASLMNARNVVLMASGKGKSEIIKQLLEVEISEQLPISFLKNHPSFYVFLDKEAASLVEAKNYE
jgi:galactosamine-6-phosphate isomerase